MKLQKIKSPAKVAALFLVITMFIAYGCGSAHPLPAKDVTNNRDSGARGDVQPIPGRKP